MLDLGEDGDWVGGFGECGAGIGAGYAGFGFEVLEFLLFYFERIRKAFHRLLSMEESLFERDFRNLSQSPSSLDLPWAKYNPS